MMFCPKCGSLLTPKKEKGTTVLNCKCGYTNKKVEEVKPITEKVSTEDKEIEVITDEETKTLPLTDEECPKCGHNKAYYWTVQTRAADEPETKFLKCEKCGHTWRDYA
ncbi:transcription factor S [Candidatus Woesearchaeota archaeon]|nr:transcription factor S [Candidatus Woesearchaeota archaeon]